jgi:HNH endonuclease
MIATKRKETNWTEQQVDLLHQYYPTSRADELKKIIGRNIKSIYTKANAIGLRKDPKYKSDMIAWADKNRSIFPKGHVPFNKGKKWDDYMSEAGKQAMQATIFKKGNLPHTNTFDGNITIRLDNKGRLYKHIRLSKAVWQKYHQYIWEQENGKIPNGMLVVFKDKNSMNCSIENLELITRKENMARNSIQRYSPELIQTIKILANVKSKLKSN